ncbi:hypothetical protein BAZMOX_112116_1 [methanotrophic endosymbiont of Bathymodiolus azoricus (Menez Gwen)]|nr:hypothetical protein BAZMOX_112116_1 [methanotrophic endosymbiont of Bathymodiolus azoricus (Menez Gwen)]
MPAYKQFMALAGWLCLKTRRTSLSLVLATEPDIRPRYANED